MPSVPDRAQRPDADALVTLYVLDATAQGGEVLRFVAAAGALREGTRQNLLPNPWFAGAVAGTQGTLPTGMFQLTITGLTRQVLGRGVEDGLPYVDLRWSGTTSVGGFVGLWFSNTLTIPAAANEPIAYGAYARLLAGGWSGSLQLRRQRANAAGGAQATRNEVFVLPTNAPLRGQRFAVAETLTGSDTAFARFGLFALISAGGAQDLTLRFGLPQYERNVPALGGPLLPPADQLEVATLGPRVRFQGQDYQPLPIEAEGFAWTGRGAPPRPRLRVANIGGVLGGLLGPGGDLLGATLTRIRTFRRFLDGEPDADLFVWPDLFAIPDIFGATSTEWAAALELRTTLDDPAAAPAWSPWQPFLVADYAARAFEFRLTLSSLDGGETRPQVADLTLEIDMPDRIEGQDAVAVPATGISIAFPIPFAATPAISVSGRDLASGDTADITAQSPSGFHLRFRDSSGTGVARTADWIAKGYGRRI